MAEQSVGSVECPLCGETFDATAAGGWCTNPDCGEWQYEEASFTEQWTGSEGGPGEIDTGDGTGGEDEYGRAGSDSGTDREAETASDEGGDDIEDEPTAVDEDQPEHACGACGAPVGPEANFCPSCGDDLSGSDGGGTLTACPACGTSVEAGDNFCAGCGTDLAGHRQGSGTVTAEETRVGTTAGKLVLATRGEAVEVADGDAIGRGLRRIIIETGGDEDQAVRIHRKHVRFRREDGQFYMVDLGTNPTRLNGRPLQKGDREPISAGDEIELSGVIGLVVREP
jgi:RNA polymerase subunit RPABC4/transcription elongation factor Spt4